MTSEVDDLADEMSRRLQEGVEASGPKEPSPYISQMESLRCHLKNMLTLGNTATLRGDVPEKRLEQQSDSTSTLLNSYSGQDLSPPLSLTGLEGLFPRYSTLYNAAPLLPDLHLRDALEKETARRKHLERHIQKLQNEMLELQQRVSVTLTADRRKDAMIQQLDQTLALVVGGWKQQEQQREETMRRLRQEKEDAEQARSRDQETLTRVQRELAQSLESLERDNKTSEERQRELQRLVDEQTARVSQLQAGREDEEEAREEQRRELESLQYRMQEQQRSWEEREQELQEESRRVQEEGRRELEKEKALTQQETQKSQQWQLALSTLQGEVLRLERELQTSHRERDTLQMELNLEKAQNESEKMRIESEHKMRLEETITERLGALHEESAQHLCSVREQQRRQLLDLASQHETELSNQLSQFKSELQERERRHRDVIMEYELKLSQSDERCQELSRALRRLESEKAQKLSQLQDVMKSHWSQALQVLAAQAPSVGSSLFVQQTEPGERWTSHQSRDGGYGKAGDQTGQGEVGASDLIGSTSQQLQESPGSRTVSDRSSQNIAGGSHFDQNRSQHVEDGTKQQTIDNRSLAQSSSSDLMNFSRVMDDRNQKSIGFGHFQEPSPRFMEDITQISNKAMMGNNAGGQSFLGGIQSNDNISQLAKALGTSDTTRQSLFNSDSSHRSGQDNLQQTTDSDTSRKYMFGNYVKEPYGQSMTVSGQNLVYSETSNFNIGGGHSVKNSQSQTVLLRDSNSRNLHIMEGIHQSKMGRQNSVNTIGSSQFKNSDDHSFASSYSQPPTLVDHSSSQTHATRNHTKADISHSMIHSSHLKGFSSHLTRPGHSQTPVIIPHHSHIAKESILGPSREYRIHSDYQEDSIGSHQPSQRVTDSEESFYPMHMEELSHSFSSHHGFYPLEPHPDGTMTTTVSTTLPQTSPEHPFQEESSLNTMEVPQNWRASNDRVPPNPVLQYYIRMLLDRTPGDPLNELDKDPSHVNPDVTELCQYLMSTGNQPPHRLDEKKPDISLLQTNPRKQPESRAPEVVKKEVLSSQRRPNPSKPLKRVAARGGRTGVWK
ncbi:centrobin isoform X2 [Mixophyes fleayi]